MYFKAAEYIKERIDGVACVGVVLGSGLGGFADLIERPIFINYSDIPGFKASTIEGHIGRFVFGTYRKKNVIAMQGRFHFYEGYEAHDIALPIRAMKALGVENLIITNAAGGINTEFKPGDLMLIKDHINFAGINPLRGPNMDEIGPRFPDMTYAYDPSLLKLASGKAHEMGLLIKQGVYAMMSGPSYETPAEIRMLRVLGADAVGMSTVPEVLAAVHAGMRVLAISCITNMAAGILDQPLSHKEVLDTAQRVRQDFTALMGACIQDI